MSAKYRFISFLLVLAGLGIAYFDAVNFLKPESFLYSRILSVPFKLGLDLQGGVHLTYKADLSAIKSAEAADAMEGLRDVIERRVNAFGVGEPLVQEEKKNSSRVFVSSDLTGRYLKKAILDFDQTTFGPVISLEFNDEGGKLFAKLTKENVGKSIAIFLDGQPISVPNVREEITGGKAQITGQFTPQEAKLLVQRLNSGALPVPVSLISQQSVGPTLGEKFLAKGVMAGIYGMILVSLFLILWYRLPGLAAVLALGLYTIIILALFKLIPVTLTAAGIAGFILSVGMAVDANILIFERMKEELKKGKNLQSAVSEGFSRAWLSIRDSNI